MSPVNFLCLLANEAWAAAILVVERAPGPGNAGCAPIADGPCGRFLARADASCDDPIKGAASAEAASVNRKGAQAVNQDDLAAPGGSHPLDWSTAR